MLMRRHVLPCMDTNSRFLELLCYDPSIVMHARQCLYGYLGIGNDAPIVTKGLWRFICDYTNSHPEVELQLNGSKIWRWPSGNIDLDNVPVSGYYNNFEIVKLEAFRKPEVKKWLYHLAQYQEGFYKWRWGECRVNCFT